MNGKNLALAKKYDVFIFDWDGTLSSVKLLRLLNEKFNPTWGYRKRHALEKPTTLKNYHYDPKEIRNRTEQMKFLAPFVDISFMFMQPKLHNDARDVLVELRKRKKKIVLFTNGAQYRILPELRVLKIEKYFDLIISAQDINALKPNPLGIEIILKELKCKRNKAIYTGDMVNDIIMAKYAKISSCAMACGFDEYGELKARKPDYIFKSMEEFKKAL